MLQESDKVAAGMNQLPSELYFRFLTNETLEIAKTKV